MQLTRERPPATPRVGLFRRILLREDSKAPFGFRDAPPDFLDLRTPLELDEAAERIERLEVGMQLIAETMKRTYGRLAAAIHELGGKMAVGTTVEEVQHVVADALQPVAAALGDIAETLRVIPLQMAAAADHVAERAQAALAAAEAEGRLTPSDLPPAPVALLPVVPFDLEPVEEEFDPLTALRRARFAVDELDPELEGLAG
jgi:hypothetical protein